MHLKYRNTCRVCGSPHLLPVIDLGPQFLQGSFIKEGVMSPTMRKLPTQLVRCDISKNESACDLLQTRHTVPPEILYSNYWYTSGTNRTMRDHLGGIVESVLEMSGKNLSRVLDIGCNDGTLLSKYPDDVEKLGVDPSDIAQALPENVRLFNTIFPSAELDRYLNGEKIDVVSSIAMFYDLESPVDFAKSIAEKLSEDGIWVFEMSYMPLMLEKNAFDTICHEHLEYYSMAVIENILDRSGLRLFRASLNDTNGGSIRCYATHKNNFSYDSREDARYISYLRNKEFDLALDEGDIYREFQERITYIRVELRRLISEIVSKGGTVHVYGASTKGNTILQWCGIDHKLVKYASDRNPMKDGAMTIGTEIQIISEEKSRKLKPDYYLVLPWHFKKEFLEREKSMIDAGTKLIFPLPTITIIDKSNYDEQCKKLDTTVEW